MHASSKYRQGGRRAADVGEVTHWMRAWAFWRAAGATTRKNEREVTANIRMEAKSKWVNMGWPSFSKRQFYEKEHPSLALDIGVQYVRPSEETRCLKRRVGALALED